MKAVITPNAEILLRRAMVCVLPTEHISAGSWTGSAGEHPVIAKN